MLDEAFWHSGWIDPEWNLILLKNKSHQWCDITVFYRSGSSPSARKMADVSRGNPSSTMNHIRIQWEWWNIIPVGHRCWKYRLRKNSLQVQLFHLWKISCIYIYYRYTCRNEDFPLTILWRFPTSSTSLSSEMWAVRFPNRRKTVVSQVFRARSVPTAPISVKPTETVWFGETFSFLESLEVTDHLSHFDPCCCW